MAEDEHSRLAVRLDIESNCSCRGATMEWSVVVWESNADVSDRSRNRANRGCSPEPVVQTMRAISAYSVALLCEVSSGPRGPDYDCDFCRKRQCNQFAAERREGAVMVQSSLRDGLV